MMWPRWIHFHGFLRLFLWIHLHGLHGVRQEDKPVLAWDCPHGMPPISCVLRPGCRTRGSPSSIAWSHATLHLIFIRGFHAAISFTATAGSLAAIWPMGTPLLPTALRITLPSSLHTTTAPLVRPRPPAAGCLRGRPVPRIAAVPVISPIIVSGPGSRLPPGTDVFCAAGAVPLPMRHLSPISCHLLGASSDRFAVLTPRRAAARLAPFSGLPPAAYAGSQRTESLSKWRASGRGPLL